MARSGVIYGPTGSGKTTQVKRFARYIAETTGKATLLLSCDGGGWDPCNPEVASEMIIPFRVDSNTVPLTVLRGFSQGYRTKKTGEVSSDKIDLMPMNFEEIGGIAVEGWTSISNVTMRYLPDKGISVGGEDRNKANANMSFTETISVEGVDRSVKFGSNTRGDYGFVQRMLYGLVMNFNSLPVRYVLYTALEAKTEDDDRSTVYGPEIAGKKATAQCGSWVGDLIHAQDYQVFKKTSVPDPSDPKKTIEQQTIDLTVRFYFKKHLDPSTGLPFPAKTRVTPERIAELERIFPGGYFEPSVKGEEMENGFDRYLTVMDQLAGQPNDALKNWRDKLDQKLGRKSVASSK